MIISNKYYDVSTEGDGTLLRFWPKGDFALDKEELDLYIGTLRSLREYLYE